LGGVEVLVEAMGTGDHLVVVRVGHDRGGELEYWRYSHLFYNHEVEEPILGIGPGDRVQGSHPILAQYGPGLVGILGYGEGSDEIVAGSRRQDGQGHARGEIGLAEAVYDLADPTVAPDDHEKAVAPHFGSSRRHLPGLCVVIHSRS
jgi:hypothetical protein